MIQKRWRIKDQSGFWLTEDMRLMPDEKDAGWFSKTEAERRQLEKFGGSEFSQIIEASPVEIRMRNLHVGRHKSTRRRRKHLILLSGMPKRKYLTENALALLSRLDQLELDDETKDLLRKVKTDYKGSIDAWKRFYRSKLEVLNKH